MGFDLFRLFICTVTYYTPFTDKKKCIQEITQLFLEGGCVWQKFAQIISMKDELLGKDLAEELRQITFNCYAHEDTYSERIIHDAFGNKYNTKKMKLLGSGTIGQVYKVPLTDDPDKNVAIKVMHPNAKKEILESIEYYENIKESYLFPSKFKNICELFFTGLKPQIDMDCEFNNGKLFKSLFPENSIFLIPEMIEKSKKCLVMEYFPCILAVNCLEKDIYPELIMKMITAIYAINYECMLNGNLLHLDLHCGNYGIYIPNKKNSTLEEQQETMRVVLYDFGQMGGISSFNKEKIQDSIISYLEKNVNKFCDNLFFKKYKKGFLAHYNMEKIEDVGDKEYFFKIILKYINYILITDNTLGTNEKNILTCYSKLIGNSNLEKNLYSKFPYMEKYTSEKLYKNNPAIYLENMKERYKNYDDFTLLKSLLENYSQE
jgi:predicted unusual protein kinase regulating ubiquinone biosynthesis (AarF/ABC1/UbiB family)